MSKFFATGDSSSESESGSSDNEMADEQFVGLSAAKFVYSESESEEEKRTIRSQKDKRWEGMLNTIKALKNHMKINDWNSIQKDFDGLNKQIEKAKSVIAKEGMPKFYFQTLVTLEQALDTTLANKEAKKKMSQLNAKAANTMKQKLKKTRQQYSKELEEYAKAPLAEDVEEQEEEKPAAAKSKKVTKKRAVSESEESESESESEESDDSDAPKKKAPARSKFTKKKASSDESESESESESDEDEPRSKVTKKKTSFAADSEDEDESDAFSDDSSSSSGSEIDLSGGAGAQFTRAFWVKRAKSSSDESSDSEEDREERRRRQRESKKKKDEDLEQSLVDKEKDEAAKKEEAIKREKEQLTPEQVVRRLKELLAMRGKRGTDRLALINDLRLLSTKATEPAAQLKVSTTLAASLFDVTLNKGTYMPIPLWKECLAQVELIINQLAKNSNVRLTEDEQHDENFEFISEENRTEVVETVATTEVANADATSPTSPTAANATTLPADGIIYIHGNISSLIQGLCREYRQSLLNIDPHSLEYVSRLKDEGSLVGTVAHAQEYYHRINKTTLEAKVALLRLELVYYRYEAKFDTLRQTVEAQSEEKTKEAAENNTANITTDANEQPIVPELATFLYASGDEKTRTRAVLFHCTWLALHNRYNEARDLLLMSHVVDSIQDPATSIKTRIYYNRTLAQLGLAAFRCGEFRGSLDCLAELHQSNRLKELLAQGVSMNRWSDRDLEQEAADRRRQVPFHQHLNQDTLEAAHLVSAMLVEVPNLALHGSTNKRRVISKVFRRLYEHHQRQAFNGPADNGSTRDIVMAATRALRQGDWEQCVSYCNQLRIWDALTAHQGSAAICKHVQTLLTSRIQEESLRTYLLSYGVHFSSISLDHLSGMFRLPTATVHRLVSKLMVNEQLSGSWDQPSNIIVMQQHPTTKGHKQAQAFAEKALLFVEQNERLLEARNYQDRERGEERGGENRRQRGGEGDGFQHSRGARRGGRRY